MSAPAVKRKSVYPFDVSELVPRAQQVAVRLGKYPSRNLLKKELRVGAEKANAVLAALRESGFDPTDADAEVSRLHLVTDTEAAPTPKAPVKRPARKQPTTRSRPAPARKPVGEPVDADTEVLPTEAESPAAETAETAEMQVRPAPPADTPTKPAPEASAALIAETAETPAATVRPASEAGAPMRQGRKPVAVWPVLLLAAPAFVAIWAGWVGLGELTGFGEVNLLPGIVGDGKWSTINTAITLPIGMETYAAYAIRVWLSGQVPARARRFAKWSAIGSLALGWAGQGAYHLMAAAGYDTAPWLVTTLVSSLPVAVLGMGAALAHLVRDGQEAR